MRSVWYPVIMVALILLAALIIALGEARASQRFATKADYDYAQLAISEDARTITIRTPVPDDTRLCIEPSRERFDKVRCYTVRDLRTRK